VLSTFEIRVTSCRNVLELEQIEVLESHFASHDVFVNLPTGFGKIYIYPVFCLAKLSPSNPNCKCFSDFAAQQHHPSRRI